MPCLSSSDDAQQGDHMTENSTRRAPPPARQASSLSTHTAPYHSPLHPEPNPMDLRDLSLSNSNLDLTPLRAHYLKRTLLSLALQRELKLLHRADALAILGPPFASLNGTEAGKTDLPLTRFLMHHFVLSFPLLQSADKRFYQDLQSFVQGFMGRNIAADEDESFRIKLAKRLEKYLALVLSSGIKLADNNGKEEVVRVSDQSAKTTTTTTTAPAGSQKELPPVPSEPDDFDVNVVTVRSVVVKGRIRNGSRDEFVIRTRLQGRDVFVSRRYRDFHKLAQDLRKDFPEEDVRPPPAKDRQAVAHTSSPSPTSPTGSFDSEAAGAPSETSLARERNRLTLRAYIRHLMALPTVASSDTMKGFLTADPTTLSQSELSGMQARESLDHARDASTRQFKSEVQSRVQDLQGHLRAFKQELLEPDGLSSVFVAIRNNSRVEDLPERYRKLIEWGRISLASALYSTFLGDDDASSTLAGLKRMHGLMPYWALRGILRISNPIAMIRAFLDLFLARPFSQPSLMQRMLGGGLEVEAKELREDAQLVASKIDSDRLCAKVDAFVEAPREIQQLFNDDAANEKLDVMAVILRSQEEPLLGAQDFQRVARANAAYQVYKQKRDRLAAQGKEDPGPDNDDAWLFEDLHVYLRLIRRARDKEQLVQLIFEGSTSDILKDLVAIFYQPLATVYRAANIADSLSDLQNFINDLIKTVESAESSGSASPGMPSNTVQAFCDLCARHEQAFYNFVHRVHTKGQDLFDALLHWIERFINLVRDGLPVEPFSLEALLPHAGKERQDVIAEVDELVDYHRKLKVAAHRRMRRKVVKGELDMEAREAQDEDTAFVRDVLDGVGAQGIADDIEDDQADSDMEDVHAEGDSDDSDSENQRRSNRARQPKQAPERIEMPKLKFLPEMVDIFVELVRPGLLEARQRAKQSAATNPSSPSS